MKSIKSGDKAISFILNDYLNNTIDLEAYRGKKVVLSLLRGASCPFCNMRVSRLIKMHSELKSAGVEVIVFFGASRQEIMHYAGQQEAPFPIIPDPDLKIYKKYDIEHSSMGMIRAMMQPVKMMKMLFSGHFNLKSMRDRPIVPADFLINENQEIDRAYYGKDFGDHVPIIEILNWGKGNS